MAQYPGSIASLRSLANISGATYSASKTTVIFAEDHNNKKAEIIAIETELGTDPKGSDTDVKTRLNRLDAGNITIDHLPDADNSANGPKASLVAGVSLVMGNVCYMGSDGKMEKADADAVASAFAWAMALATIAENAAGSFALPGCFVRDDDWNWTSVGQPVYLSTDIGALTQTRPSATDDVIQIIGIAVSADVIYFNPQLVQVEHT